MLELAQLQSFRKDLLLGTGKADAHVLERLALAATQSKFERRRPPGGPTLPMLQVEERQYPSPHARRILLRLLAGKNGNTSDAMAKAVPHVLNQHGLALHPFDFAALEVFIAQYPGHLSPEARAWLRLVRPERTEIDEAHIEGPMSESDLKHASKAQRISFLRELRIREPSRARQLIEGLLPAEPAEMRLRLVSVLASNMAVEDQPLLQSLLNDRAPSVKELAQRLLDRLPGSDALQRRLKRVREDLQIKSEGLIRRRKVFVYKGPEGKAGQNTIVTLLDGLQLKDIASALGESEASLIDIARQSERLPALLLYLIRKAVDEGKSGLVENACAELAGQDEALMAALIDESFAKRPEVERSKIIALCFLPKRWAKVPEVWMLQRIAAFIPSALPDKTANDFLHHGGWQALAGAQRQNFFDAVAHLIPASHSAAFTKLAEADAPRAALYHRFLQSLTERGKNG